MSDTPESIREAVVVRAGSYCEYYQLSQAGQEASFHVDHVRPRAGGGQTVLENLALACVSCSLRKYAKLTGTDPQTGIAEPLFNPRTQLWSGHFRWETNRVVALTATGRTTVAALAMNRELILAIRNEEIVRRRHPRQ